MTVWRQAAVLLEAAVLLGLSSGCGKQEDPCAFSCPAGSEKLCPGVGERPSRIVQIEIEVGVLLDQPSGSKALDRLPKGTFLRVSGSCGQWQRAVYPDGKTRGWLIAAALERE